MNKKLSWKILLPVGIILWFVFTGGVLRILGVIMFAFGIVDLVTSRRKIN